ncbi:HNH endonuclease [Flavobacterium sp. F52]|uniref:HNH endonuclease n=1 Tax=Flavobacterium sp. F52 TaxID=1202532 RepID=UPI000272F6B5|nr:HNH endonuclease [Flavobacterium sp. F52]EJG01472.1 hypothetical protein FF52_10448 [Flavobacterium sp. F52]
MELVFDELDLVDIETAINEGGKIWYNPVLNRLKDKIKDFYTSGDTSKCCYCGKLFQGEFRMVIDIEHVLPQAHFASERFEIQNLNVACKRCNMLIKKDDLTFLINPAIANNYYDSNHYKIIHPNLDIYSDHLILKTFRDGDSIFNKYVVKTKDKGLFTYGYFHLEKTEVDTINNSQGIKGNKGLTDKIRGAIRVRLYQLLVKI